MSGIIILCNSYVVSNVQSDPTSNASYVFASQSRTAQPVVGYSLNMNHQYGATVSSNPFTVTLPAFTPTTSNIGPISASTNTTYAYACSTYAQWYLEFAFDMTSFTKTDSNFHLGTSDFYIKWLGKGVKDYYLQFNVNTSGGQIGFLFPTPQVFVRFQFVGSGEMYIYVNGNQVYYTNNTGYSAYQYLVFSHTLQSASSLLSNVPLTISNISVGLPVQTFTPSLRFNGSSAELYPFLTSDLVQSNIVYFNTPAGQISTGSNAPNIVLDQTFSNDVQSTITYSVNQVGTIPDIQFFSPDLPVVPNTLRIKELVPFTYSFSTSFYYPPTTSEPNFSNLGNTSVDIRGTSNVLMTIPTQFTDANVVGDRKYQWNYLYNNNLTLTIDLPFFTDAIDSGTIGFGFPVNGDISSSGSGSNTLTFGSNSISYSTAPRLMFTPVSGSGPLSSGFQIYVVDSSGSVTAFPGGPLNVPFNFQLMFSMNFQSSGGYSGNRVTMTLNAPAISQVTLGSILPVVLDSFASGTNYLLPYTNGTNGTSTLIVSSDVGFTTLPATIPILFKAQSFPVFNGNYPFFKAQLFPLLIFTIILRLCLFIRHSRPMFSQSPNLPIQV
jgi:hypothetical protein